MNRIKKLSLQMSFFWLSISPVFAATLMQKQQLFQDWNANYATLSQAEQQTLLKKMTDYPLYPYAFAQYMAHPKNQISAQEMQFFQTHYADYPDLPQVQLRYVNGLAKKQDWQAIIDLNARESVALNCQYLYADYRLHPNAKKLQTVNEIWLQGRDLPASCDPLFGIWAKKSYKNKAIILKRIHLLLENNHIRLATLITHQLPSSEQALKTALLSVLSQPKTLPQFVNEQADLPVLKDIAMDLFPRYLAQAPDDALALIQTMKQHYHLNAKEVTALQDRVANAFFSSKSSAEQVKWRKKHIEKSQNAALIEQEIRIALRMNNKKNRDKWLQLLPKEAQEKEEWRYWQAIKLNDQGQKEAAKEILTALAKERGFYGLMSSQKLGIPYQVDLNYALIEGASKAEEAQIIQDRYAQNKVILRIHELKSLGMQPQAKREWWTFVSAQPSDQQAQLAKFAHDKDWALESVQATIAGKHWNNWNERLPVAYSTLFDEEVAQKAISKSYSLAISRQESALDPSVKSHAGAKGLMQLMPATAKEMAKKTNLKTGLASHDLFNPQVNIALGTAFLDLVYTQFNGNRILASAAYNAGPGRVNQWLKQSNKQLDAMAFIESIPFTETRNYVKSVLTYDYLYQLKMNQNPPAMLTKEEWLRRY